MSTTQCYYPSGDAALDSTPCLSGAESFCCPTGYTCLSDKLCLPPESAFGNASFIEGTCTDLTFLSSECPSHCTADQNEFSGPIEINQCGGDPNVYCCGSCESCSTSTDSFITIIGVSTASSIARETETEVPATVTVLKTSQTTSVVRQTIFTSSTQVHSSSMATSTIASITSPSISSPGSTIVSASAPTNNINTIAIAVGVTIPAAVVIAGVLLWLFFWRRSRRTSFQHTEDDKHDKPLPIEPSASNWTPRNWSNTLQELPGDTGASEMYQTSIPKSEPPATSVVPLSPLSIRSPATPSPETTDIISPLSVKDSTKRSNHELPG